MPGILRDPVLPDGHPHPCALPSMGASCPMCSLSASFFSLLFAEGRNQSVDGRETGQADRHSGLPDRGCRQAQTGSEAASVSTRRIRGRSAGAGAHSAPCTLESLSTSAGATRVHSGPFSASASSCFLFILDSFSPEFHSSSACDVKQSPLHDRLMGRLRGHHAAWRRHGAQSGPRGEGALWQAGISVIYRRKASCRNSGKVCYCPIFPSPSVSSPWASTHPSSCQRAG